jgi:hypothetical protein
MNSSSRKIFSKETMMNIYKFAAITSFVLGAWLQTVSLASADFLHIATTTTISNNSTYLDGFYINNNPNRLLLVTPVGNPAGGTTGVLNNHPIGVWYDSSRARWAIFNQDGQPIPIGAAFYVNDSNPSNNFIVQRATTATAAGNSLYIDNPYSNGHPEAILYVMANWNAGGVGVFNNHYIGVWYDITRGKWAIFNQDRQPIPPGTAFNVLIMPPGTVTWHVVHRATAANTVKNSTYLSDRTLPPPGGIGYWWLTANWNPGGAGGVYNNHPIGVWYDSIRRQWAIFNQDRVPMPIGAAFNINVQRIP